MKSTILKGVHIGNNVIIGANSLVNKDIPDNCVAAGNPCKVIMGLEAYHEKRKAAQVAEARELVQLYRERYGREPDEKALHEGNTAQKSRRDTARSDIIRPWINR